MKYDIPHAARPSIWRVPYLRNPHFIDREAALAELHAFFVPGEFRAHAILGAAGVGKTQLALHYAHVRANDYDEVLWLGGETLAALRANLAALTADPALQLSEAVDQPEVDQIALVLDWLRARDHWLLVCDDAGTAAAETLLELLADAPNGHVLITSRRIDWPIALADLTLERFSEDVSVQFLRGRTRGWQAGSEAEAATLARECGGAPLALEQAAAYVETQRITYATYLAKLRAAQQAVGAAGAAELAPPTWRINEAELGSAARALLRLAAFFGPSGLPRAAFEHGSAPFREAVALIGGAEPDASGAGEVALAQLAKYALVTLSPSTFWCRLSPEILRASIPEAERATWFGLARRVFEDALVRDEKGRPSERVLWALQDHALALLQLADELDLQLSAARLFADTGALLHKRGRHYQAEPLLRTALTAYESELGTDHAELFVHVARLAGALTAMSRTEEAEPLTQRSLVLR